MNPAQAAATLVALDDDPRLVAIARQHLEAAAAAETRSSMLIGTPLRDAAVDPRPGDIGPVIVDLGNGDGPVQVNAEVDSVLYLQQTDAARAARAACGGDA